MKKVVLLFFVVLDAALSAPPNTLIVTSTEYPQEKDVADVPSNSLSTPIIYEMTINSNISNRFAKTLVSSYVKNPKTEAQETTFTIVLPEKAFISEFILKIGGKEYKAYVKEKEEAKQIYDQAVQRGQTAGHVSVSARDSNKFTVSVNVEPEAKAAFLLTYEELLERKNSQYELVLNIHPGQVVKKFEVEVYINESRPLRFVKTPSLRSGNEIEKSNENLNPSADIEVEGKTAVVKFAPDVQDQKKFAKEFAKEYGAKESEGLTGQFVVQYDVERDPNGGEVLLQDGYFVHFFAPDDLQPLKKHIVFLLDTSGSMGFNNRKIEQLKEAMDNILSMLPAGDIFSIIEFNTYMHAWDISKANNVRIELNNYEDPFSEINPEILPQPSSVDDETITNAKKVISKLHAGGGTNIMGGLDVALAAVKMYANLQAEQNKNIQPIIMFLTDGEPMGGISNTKEITRIVTKLNSENNNVPIYSLSFGDGADKDFLRKLSSKNYGFSRHIYEAADASLQLQNFYKEISSPLLSNIKFTYVDALNLTKTKYPVIYKGSEITICGNFDEQVGDPLTSYHVKIEATGRRGPISLQPTVSTPVSSLERLWAYLTIKQKLESRDLVDNPTELSKEALDLALKYSFVTDVTSLVVVKPNDTHSADIEDARPGATPPPLPRPMSAMGPPPGLSGQRGHSGPYFLRFGGGGGYGSYGSGGYGSYGSSSYGRRNYNYVPSSSYAAPAPQPVSTNYGVQSIRVITTPAPLMANTQSSIVQNLPWLSPVLNSNGQLQIKQGTYDLGDYYTPASHPTCPRTPHFNSTGECTLLRLCSHVHTYLTDLQTYEQYFCVVDNGYAGVCCPTVPIP